jgi:hypothetical protein
MADAEPNLPVFDMDSQRTEYSQPHCCCGHSFNDSVILNREHEITKLRKHRYIWKFKIVLKIK